MTESLATKAPKYLQLAGKLTADFEAGVLRPGDRLPTFDVLRARYNVAISTLDRAFIELEQNGIVRREPGRGIFVAERASSQKGYIGFVSNVSSKDAIYEQQKFYSSHLMEGVDSVIQQQDMGVILLNENSAKGWDMVDGVLVCNKTDKTLELLKRYLPAHAPWVSLIVDIEGVPGVMIDEQGGARLAIRHLIDLGHRRIASLLTNSRVARRRLAGFEEAILDLGMENSVEMLRCPVIDQQPSTPYRDWARESTRIWLQQVNNKPPVTALLAQNDWAAIGAMESLRDAGLRVPEDISVIGFDGTEICDLATPRLTSIEVPLDEIARKATELLLRKINDGSAGAAEKVVLTTQLRPGASTAPPRDAAI